MTRRQLRPTESELVHFGLEAGGYASSGSILSGNEFHGRSVRTFQVGCCWPFLSRAGC
ncbi:hypothetical protein CBM2633_P10019 [Cupriavidus taiwanensis]|uniref:Uncharacterized protein n=2 Tax=Cupriavidus TaxID=106589 RepID=A0A375DA67_9BURK|nr:hypothetical protein CBM2592_P10019 [Cupriavidus taiwanensis]SPD62006.1 protein of unknown function [Cupriavidus neocaledonicus]SOY73996.1 hypothetical protein CBM2588_P10019 [Cupriavidus taiwanensis]SOY75223.1 hypothetical protein CBM2589_P10019 [Cupriavidus taiwanensis]SOY98678.1 hypothetical protein CBM2591_P10019 [Cupriavidus taiwanensis]